MGGFVCVYLGRIFYLFVCIYIFFVCLYVFLTVIMIVVCVFMVAMFFCGDCGVVKNLFILICCVIYIDMPHGKF